MNHSVKIILNANYINPNEPPTNPIKIKKENSARSRGSELNIRFS